MALLSITEIQSLDRAGLNRMTSDSFKENHDKTNPNFEQFRARVDAVENDPHQATRPAGNVRGPEPAPTPAESSFDPSFDDQPTSVAASAPAPVLARPAAQPAAVTDFSNLPELLHEYQPEVKDKATGKVTPIGGRQVFKYRTVNDPNDPNSLVMQMQRAHSHASARIRLLSRDRKLDEIATAGAAPRIQPEKEVPTTMEGLAAELRAQREANYALSVRAALQEFQTNVGWTKYRSNENANSVILAVERAGDDPTDSASYVRAFQNMQQFLEPVAPATAEVPVPAPAPAPAVVAQPKVASAVPPSNAGRFGTGLSNADAFNNEDNFEVAPAKVAGVRLTMPDGKKQVMTLQEWNRQSSEFQKRVLRSSANAAQIEALYDAEDQRKAAARSGR